MDINVKQLFQELLDAGIDCGGCNDDGIVWGLDGLTEIQNKPEVKAIITKHDPIETPEETLEQKIERIVIEKISELQ